jgi:hypothetical protein
MDAYKNIHVEWYHNRTDLQQQSGCAVELSLLHVFVGQIPLSKERDFSKKE